MSKESGGRNRLARDRLRMKVQAAGDELLADLMAIREATKDLKEERDEEAKRWTRPSLDAMQLRATINLALLKKVLPDLKHMELANDGDGPLRISVVSYAARPDPQ